MLYVCWCCLNSPGKKSVSIDTEQKWKSFFWILWVVYQNFHVITSNTSHSSEVGMWEVCVRAGNCSLKIPLLSCGAMPICKSIWDPKGLGNTAFMSIFEEFCPKDTDSKCTETLDLSQPCWITRWNLGAVFQLLHTVQLPQIVHLWNVLLRKEKKELCGNAVSQKLLYDYFLGC